MASTNRPGAHVWVPVVLALLVLASSVLWFPGVPILLKGSALQFFGAAAPAPAFTDTPTAFPPIAASATGTSLPVIPLAVAPITVAPAISTIVVLDGSTPTNLPNPTRPVTCGHQLDEPFGLGRQFIVHRVQPGESLEAYAARYQTDLATIRGVNARPVIPLQEGQIIVIPVNQAALDEVPRFEAYLLSERTTKYAQITTQLGVTNLYEFLLYNGLATKCASFYGWVLAPRDVPTPQPTQVCYSSDSLSAVICYPTATPTHKEHGP